MESLRCQWSARNPENCKLIPSDSGNNVRLPKRVLQDMGDVLQGEVAPHVTALIIDGLEPIEIREGQGCAGLLASGDFQLVITQRHESAAIIDACKLVNERQGMEFADPAVPRNRILDGTNHVVRIDALLDEVVLRACKKRINAGTVLRFFS